MWPLLHVLDWVGGRTDEATVRFSIDRARDEAWAFAVRLAGTPESAWAAEIEAKDRIVTELGGLVRRPGILLGTVLRAVRLGELRSTEGVIDLLS